MMADDIKANGETLEDEIRRDLKNYDDPSSKMYVELVEKINRFHSVNGLQKLQKVSKKEIDQILNGLEFRIKLLNKTPAKILHFKFISKPKIYFIDFINLFEGYKKYYWEHIVYEFCQNINNNTIKIIAIEACLIVDQVDSILKYQKQIEGNKDLLLADGEKYVPKYESYFSEFKSVVENGKQKLESIIPLFSVWGNLGQTIKNDIIKNKKSVEEDVKRMLSLEDNIKNIGKNVVIIKASEGFKKAYKEHKKRANCAAIGAMVTGGLTVLWGVLSQWIFSKDYGDCSYKIGVDSFLCKLFSIEIRELLIGGVLLGFMYAFLRSYFANSHSESVNRHRYNSLQSYRVLSETTQNNKESEFILHKATEAIYKHIPTGFTKYHKDENDKSTDSVLLAALVAAIPRLGQSGGGSGSS